MDLVIAEQGSFCLKPALAYEDARDRAVSHKRNVFGALTALVARPKPEDVELADTGMRYDPLWNAALHLRLVYDRHETYHIPFRLPTNITSITVGDKDFRVDTTGKNPGVPLSAIAHHVQDIDREVWLDAVTSQPIKTQIYAKADRQTIDLNSFSPEDGQVVMPLVRASTVIRDLLGDDIKPVEADLVHEEAANIERLDLYLRPMYCFHYEWPVKQKKADIAIDGITGEITAPRGEAAQLLTKLLDKDTLFDITVETVHSMIPFGGVPIRIVQALTRQQRG